MEVSEILEQVDIVDYISQYVDLEEKNSEFWGLSPFQSEKTPSFSVNREKNNFFDFSAGFGGNLLSFIQRYNNCSLYNAVAILKAYAGITDEVNISNQRLETTKVAKRYKRRDNIFKEVIYTPLPADYMDRYEHSPEKLQIWESEGISFDSMKKFDVRYDPFSDRIVFPIRSYNGDIINISGRTLDPNYKEKKLRKYTYFHNFKGGLDTLYGFYENRDSIIEKKEIILFEGAKSVLIADTWGLNNTSAVLTSHLNPQQMLFLIKLGIRVVFAFDKEVKIPEDKNIERLKKYTQVEYICDTNDLLNEKMSPVDNGKEVFKTLYRERKKF